MVVLYGSRWSSKETSVNSPHFLYAFYGDAKGQGDLSGLPDGELRSPMAITVAPDGRIFVADTGNSQIWVFKSDGESVSRFGKGLLNHPLGLIYVANKVYVADPNQHKVFVFDDRGQPLAPLADNLRPPNSAEVMRPSAIALGPDKLFYLADIANQKIIVLDSGGRFIRQFGGPGTGQGQFEYPNGLWVDGKGVVYVADSNNGRIEIFDNKGHFLSQISGVTATGSGGLRLPRGLAVTPSGQILVVDVFANRVYAFDVSGHELWHVGGAGTGNGQFNFPNGLSLDSDGRIYVTDRENNRVQVLGY